MVNVPHWWISSVQFSPFTEWVVGGTWGTIQQRSSSGLFWRRPLWTVLAWVGMCQRVCLLIAMLFDRYGWMQWWILSCCIMSSSWLSMSRSIAPRTRDVCRNVLWDDDYMTFRNDGILPTTTICLSGLPHYTEWCGHNYSADDCYTEQCATSTGVEISAEKTKLMTYNTSGINTEIKVNVQNHKWSQLTHKKDDRYWSDGQNTALSCTITRPIKIHEYWTIPRQTQRITTKEMAAAIQSLKKGKSAGVDNIPAELAQAGGQDVITTLTTIWDKIWPTRERPTPWTQSLVMTLPKQGNLYQCQNYRTISLISHPSKVILKIILNRLKPQTEKIIVEEQAGFRAERSTTEQIFNIRILCEKYLQYQQDLYYVFKDFKKAFDRVWHAALWATMKKYNISANLIRVIKKSLWQGHQCRRL